jgi:hypothetical protein
MSTFEQSSQLGSTLDIQACQRWLIYHRLLDLGIPCWCKAYHPLRVQIESPSAAIQCHQIIRRFTASKQELVDWLETCWQQQI